MPAGGRVGHVHLQVGALDTAERFYADLLGFDVMCRYRARHFLGAGGYHTKLATNIWNSRGARCALRAWPVWPRSSSRSTRDVG